MHTAIRQIGYKRLLTGLLATTLFVGAAQAQKKYDTGATDSEIKLGNLVPYSGPVSAYGVMGKSMAAYFDKVNAEGGINGRKVKLSSLDDGYNPARSVELTRQLVEQEGVLAMVGSLGTAHNAAVQKYMNAKKVPQLFINSSAMRWNDPKHFPWTMSWLPSLHAEGELYARHILAANPQAKVAVLSQNDDYGRELLKGLTDGLGAKATSMLAAQTTYETTDPTLDSQLISLKGSGANVLVLFTTAKASIQAIRKVAALGWKPTIYLANAGASAQSVLKPAGFENATGLISSAFRRDPTDPAWKGSKELADYLAWMKKYYPAGDPEDALNVVGYLLGQIMEQTLRQAGDNLTRENVMKQAASLDMSLPMLLPGVRVKTSADDFEPISTMRLTRFNGRSYELIDTPSGR